MPEQEMIVINGEEYTPLQVLMAESIFEMLIDELKKENLQTLYDNHQNNRKSHLLKRSNTSHAA